VDIKVGVIDCDAHEEVCARQGLRSYPAFKLCFEGGYKLLDDAAITSKSLLQFIEDSLPNALANLRLTTQVDELFQKSKAKHGALIFINPEYDTPLLYKVLGYKYSTSKSSPSVVSGEVRGSNDKLYKYLHIAQAPVILMYCGGDKDAVEKYDGDVKDYSSIVKFISKFQSPSRCKDLLKKTLSMRSIRQQAAHKARKLNKSDLTKKRVTELRSIVEDLGLSSHGLLEKDDFVKAILGVQKVEL
jgi:hypothetical protein